jgi:hypothetical protein
VISAEASFTIDIRHPDDAVRLEAIQASTTSCTRSRTGAS